MDIENKLLNNKYVQKFLKRNLSLDKDIVKAALIILDYVSDMGLLFDYTDDIHLEILTNALEEESNNELVASLIKVKTDADYLDISLPKNKELREYVESGQRGCQRRLADVE